MRSHFPKPATPLKINLKLSQRQGIVRRFASLFAMAAWSISGVHAGAFQKPVSEKVNATGNTDLVSIINYATTPVYSTAVSLPFGQLYKQLNLPVGTPLEAVNSDGKILPVFAGKLDGQDVARVYLSLKAGERVDLKIRKANAWGQVGEIAQAEFDKTTGSARLSNGVVAFEYREGIWSFSYAGPMADAIENPKNRMILENGRFRNGWIDEERRGRLMGYTPEKIKELGLISFQEAKLLSGEAEVLADGSAVLKLKKGFKGFASDVVWTEVYTLQSGEPILTYNTQFSCTDDKTRYLAYVELGSGVEADYGNLIKGKLRFKYDQPNEPKRVLLSGSENNFTRIGWRKERCWAGVDSELGNGVGFSNLKDVTREVPGNSVWSIGNGNFLARFLHPEQENLPYEFSAAKPLELGFAFVATCGNTSVWEQTKKLFQDVTAGKNSSVDGAYAVYLGGQPIRSGKVSGFAYESKYPEKLVANGVVREAALQLDFHRGYRIAAKASGASEKSPIEVKVYPVGEPDKSIKVLTLNKEGEQEADFTAVTGWNGKQKDFIIEITESEGADLEKLTLEPSSFPAPELHSPAAGMHMTDIAAFYRWKQVKGAIDYEIQLSKDDQFSSPTTLSVRSEVDWPYYLPADDELPAPGTWFWRVRAVEPGRPGLWSASRELIVNNDHSKSPVIFKITPEHPIFTLEACMANDLSKFTSNIPADIKSHIAITASHVEKGNLMSYMKPLNEAGISAFIRTHGPGPMSYWAPLTEIERLFQNYPHVIGIMGGETLGGHYHGGNMQTYLNRLLKLCGKYGRLFYEADGSYPKEFKYQAAYEKIAPLFNEYGDYLILAQKNNILHRQFVSQSAVLGLYLSNAISNQGAWEDGGWYWQQTGFRTLGDIRGQRGGDVTTMPKNFWNLNFLMGVSRGCAVFSFEGQVGTTPVPVGWKLSENTELPETAKGPYRNPAAFWTTEGEFTPAFYRYHLPFMRAVIKQKLVPTKEEVLENIHLAVYNDGVPKKEDGDQYYYEWKALYEGTYGFKDYGVIPGTLMEFFPDTGRYYYIPVLPQGKVDLGHGIESLPLSKLGDAKEVRERFNKSYPEWYQGDALVTIVGDTITVMNSNENRDETQTYAVPLQGRGAFEKISGKISPHAYLMGKFDNSNKALWLQANVEYEERDTELVISCKSEPKVKVTPESASQVNRWDPSSKSLTLQLSHKHGAVEVNISQ
jgi:hypothetical protein